MDVNNARTFLVILLVCLFCVPAAPASASGPHEGAAHARGTYIQQDPFDMEFDNVTYSNSSFSLSLPTNSTIYSASVDLQGEPVVSPPSSADCDFSGDGTDFVAYTGTYSKNSPGTAKPTTFNGDQLQQSDLSKIAYVDQTYYDQYAYSWNGEYGYQHFKFKVPIDLVSNITVTWTGFSGYYYYGYGGYGTSSVYVWNNVSLAWEYIGNVSGGPKTVTKWFNGSDYVDGKGCVNVLALTKSGWTYYSGYAYNDLDTDYVKVTACGNVLIYPKNPSMDIGANGRNEWSITEDKFDYQVNVCDSGLANELQTLVKSGHGRYTDIKVRFRSATVGRMNMTNLTVTYNAPPWCRGIPGTFALDEDTPTTGLIDLNHYFEDDSGDLHYDITYKEDSKKLDAQLDADGHSLDFTLSARNWWGKMGFRVRATDSDDLPLSCESNLFNVTVRPVNDPPVINPIPRQVGVQDTPFRMTVIAKDVDMELDPTETITFSDNTSLFNIEASTGVIAFTPRQDQVGTYQIQITATDLAGATDRKNFTLEIMDAEDPPILQAMADQTAVQDQPFSCAAAGHDQDIPYGDSITYTDDSPLFAINASTGLISFTPTVRDIGVHVVTIAVTDSHGASDSKSFNLTVLNTIGGLDRPPAMEPIPNQNATEGLPFECTVKASDPDLTGGDVLRFSDDCPLFDIDNATGKISFTPGITDPGVYWVNITVRDRDGLSATRQFRLAIFKINHAPGLVSVSPTDGTNITLGEPVVLVAVASDYDHDPLNYTWKEGDNLLGYGANITVTFDETRTYFITLIVSDGQLEVSSDTSVVVNEPARHPSGVLGRSPGFESVFAAGALAAAALVIALRRRKS